MTERRCYYEGCLATWRHWHGFLPGGYDNPEDPEGIPIIFEGDDPEPDAVRDYNGAALPPAYAAFKADQDRQFRRLAPKASAELDRKRVASEPSP